MTNLLFKEWLISEFADYGYESRQGNKPKGGTDIIPGEDVYEVLDPSIIIQELSKMSPIGPNKPEQKWDCCIEWGTGFGAVQLEYTPLGSVRMIVRKKIFDLEGQETWICKYVEALDDVGDSQTEYALAIKFHEVAEKQSQLLTEGPLSEFDELERLAWRLWAATKRDHPSYAMFPIGLKKQNEDYYKLVFEFRGGGQGDVNHSGFLRQFDIDLFWDKKKGLIKCWGYNIDSAKNRSAWEVNPSEWNEWFSPAQDHTEIIKCVVTSFMQY